MKKKQVKPSTFSTIMLREYQLKKDKFDMTIENRANIMAYSIQDLLDDFSNGGRFDFTHFEKMFLKELNQTVKETKELYGVGK